MSISDFRKKSRMAVRSHCSFQGAFVRAIAKYRAACLVLFSVMLPVALGCRNEKAEIGDKAAWQSSFRGLVGEMCALAQKAKPPSAKEMDTRLNEIWAMTDGAGYVVDCNPPIGTLQHEANDAFTGKSFDWAIPVQGAEWSDSSHSSVFITVPLDDVVVGQPRSHVPKSVTIRLYGEKQLPSAGVLKVSGILGKPGVVVAPESAVKQGMSSQECWLSGVCVVYFPNNNENEYELIIVLNGRWGRFDSVRRRIGDRGIQRKHESFHTKGANNGVARLLPDARILDGNRKRGHSTCVSQTCVLHHAMNQVPHRSRLSPCPLLPSGES